MCFILRLHNFPLDIQELSVALCSKLGKNQVKLLPNPKRFSNIDVDATSTFIDQQKWYYKAENLLNEY